MNRNDEVTYKYLKDRTVGVVGVTAKEGQNLEGPEKAPEHLRSNGLFQIITEMGWNYKDYKDIGEESIKDSLDTGDTNSYKYNKLKNSIQLGAICKQLNETTKKIAEEKQLCLTLGGDHGLATGSISGMKSVYKNLKIVWVDAHADCNVPEDSPSGNYHGMPVAHLLGWIPEKTVPGFDWFQPCLDAADIVYIALRDVDEGEKRNLKKHNIKCFSMHDVVELGMANVMEQTFEYLGRDNPIHISFDIDGIDPQFAPGTGTRARGGLLYREAHYLVREVAKTGKLVSLDLVEINPTIDRPKEMLHGDFKCITGTETVALGLELVASALGYTLL